MARWLISGCTTPFSSRCPSRQNASTCESVSVGAQSNVRVRRSYCMVRTISPPTKRKDIPRITASPRRPQGGGAMP
jgi:hypothetical protein